MRALCSSTTICPLCVRTFGVALIALRTFILSMANKNNVKSIPIGTRFGSLVVIGVGIPKLYGGCRNSTSRCQCDCGIVKDITNNSLLKGSAKTCGAGIHHKKGFHSPYYLSNGYKMVYKPDHPKSNKIGYVREHVLVMENHIGRYLTDEEVVHHKDRNRSNNELENLQLLLRREHNRLHAKDEALKRGRHLREEKVCPICGKHTARFGTLCRTCATKKQTKIKLPSLEELQNLIDTLHLEEVARRVGVTSNALRRWIKKLHLTYIPKKREGNATALFDPANREKAHQGQIEYYKTHRFPLHNRIGQYAQDGTLVREYDAILDVENFGFNKTCVSRAARGLRKQYKGFEWRLLSPYVGVGKLVKPPPFQGGAEMHAGSTPVAHANV